MAAPQDYFQRIDLTLGDTQLDRSGDNVREDFMNAIYNIAPTQTPFMSGIGRENSKDVYTSWQQDDLEEPNDGNAALDGADIDADVSSPARRVGNIAQISRKSLIVSGRANAVDKAGRSSEMAYQLAKASKALKRDMEAILTSNQAAAPDLDGNTASKTGGLRACYRDAIVDTSEVTSALAAGDGSNGGVVTTPGSETFIPGAAVDGTARALSMSDVNAAIEAIYMNGGEPDTIMVSPTMKRQISEFLYTSSARVAALYSDTPQKRSEGGNVANSSIDLYVSDFGALKIMPNRFQGYTRATHAPRHQDVHILDMSMWATGFLRPFRTIEVAKTGDAEKRLLLVDYMLVYKNEMGSGGVFDIDPAQPVTA